MLNEGPSPTLVHHAESLYREIYNLAADALIISDPESGRILLTNPAACSMQGYTLEEITQLNSETVGLLNRRGRNGAARSSPGKVL